MVIGNESPASQESPFRGTLPVTQEQHGPKLFYKSVAGVEVCGGSAQSAAPRALMTASISSRPLNARGVDATAQRVGPWRPGGGTRHACLRHVRRAFLERRERVWGAQV